MAVVSRWLSASQTSMQVVVSGLSGLDGSTSSCFIPGLQMVAYLLLAGGLAAVTGRLAAGHAVVTQARAWRGLVCLAMLVAGMAVVWQGSSWLGERRMTAALPAARPGAPNVLLLVLDTVRADAMGSAQWEREPERPTSTASPSSGVVFDQAQSTSPWTLPSHASMFTSRLPSELTGDWLTPLDDQFPTLAEHLAEAGYATAGFVANTRYCSTGNGACPRICPLRRLHLVNRGFCGLHGNRSQVLLRAVAAAARVTTICPAESRPQRSMPSFSTGRPSTAGTSLLCVPQLLGHTRPLPRTGPLRAARPRLTRPQRQMIRNWWWMTKQELRA